MAAEPEVVDTPKLDVRPLPAAPVETVRPEEPEQSHSPPKTFAVAQG
jgi:hypothetical protein